MNVLIDACVFISSFDPQSVNHKSSIRLLEKLKNSDILITMPAHGWFEVQCTLQRLSLESRFVGPVFSGQMEYPVKLIHIDSSFIKKYSMADIPYIKAGDHIYVAIAKLDNYYLITTDNKMANVSRQCDVSVFTPEAFLKHLNKYA